MSSDPEDMVHNLGSIHVLGLGNLGLLFAHSLAKISPKSPPITLLFHRDSLLRDWELAGQKIEITTNNITSVSTGYQVEAITSNISNSPIENLILTTKSLRSKQAIESIKSRLSSQSTILFCQNGMGTIEEVATLFPNHSSRPKFLSAVTKHGVYSTGPFKCVHAGLADITIGHVLSESEESSQQAQYLLDKIVEAQILNAVEAEPKELLYLQLEKLAINSVINPLSALFRLKNGELLEDGAIVKLTDALLDETSRVLKALPEVTEAKERLGKEELREKVVDSMERTAANVSSMHQDVKAGRETEIDYINGWIVKKGKELGIETENNEKVVELIKKGVILTVEDIDGIKGVVVRFCFTNAVECCAWHLIYVNKSTHFIFPLSCMVIRCSYILGPLFG